MNIKKRLILILSISFGMTLMFTPTVNANKTSPIQNNKTNIQSHNNINPMNGNTSPIYDTPAKTKVVKVTFTSSLKRTLAEYLADLTNDEIIELKYSNLTSPTKRRKTE